jgi:peptidoglycan hydrolase CwlO-like protein
MSENINSDKRIDGVSISGQTNQGRTIIMGQGNYNELIRGDYVQGNKYIGREKQNLAEAAAEIQELLKQLEKTNPKATDTQKEVFVSAGMTPTKKERLINALKEGGKGAIEEFFDNPYVNVAMKIIDGWKNA